MNGKDQFIVAIGASAGGLEAIHDFFDHMPECQNAAFVVIQHLSPDYKSLLVELVSRHTHMQVFEAEDNLLIRNNCIYIIPNNKFITIRKNKLLLEAKSQEKAPNNAVDVFLHSLAKEKKEQAVAVILSGTGTDGTKGVEAIKLEGGMVLIQEPATARFDGMPNSAISSGNVDAVLAPATMPAEVLRYINRIPVTGIPDGDIDENTLEEIFGLIHQEAGIDFHYYKTPTIVRRIVRRIDLGNFKTLDGYVGFLRENPEECRQLGKDFLIGVTRFFRDKEAFKVLEEKVIPSILSKKGNDGTVKVWVCACSTGEEAYSIAILLNEWMEREGVQLEVKIFATDPEAAHIDIATKGVYPLNIAADIPPDLLQKYFTLSGRFYTVIPVVRKQLLFARHNVIKDPPFIKNDLVTCRNMLIYMSPILQQKIYSVLLFSAKKGGYLFLGSSEHPGFAKDTVQEVSSKWKIYQKVMDSRLTGYPVGPSLENREKAAPVPLRAPKDTRFQQQLWEDTRQALEQEARLSAFYIDPSFDIREAVGSYPDLLTLSKKDLRLNLLKMVPTEISIVLNTAVRRSWKQKQPVNIRGARYKKGDKVWIMDILIKPLTTSRLLSYTLVVLNEHEAPEAENAASPVATKTTLEDLPTGIDYVKELEAALEESRTSLQAAIEDQESTNEELQSSNEEMLSANEELQSSNEELQSLNEELHTLNTEHQMKIRELIEANDDLNNYFRSTDIGQIFLDKDLRIRKFNPASARMINFIDTDLGRSITHISSNIRYDSLNQDIHSVLKDGHVVEKEVRLYDGKNLLMRIMPYLSREKDHEGVIITFVDITTVTELNNIIRGIFNSSPSAILALRSIRDIHDRVMDFAVLASNYAAGGFFGAEAGEYADFRGKMIKRDIPVLASEGLLDIYITVVQEDRKVQLDVFIEEQGKWFEVTAVKMMDGLVATFTDTTEKKMADQKIKKNYVELISVKENLRKLNTDLEDKVRERTQELSRSEERFRLVARATNDALWDWDFVNNKHWWGEAFYKLFGYKVEEAMDRSFWLSKIHPNDRQGVEESLFSVINSNENTWSQEYRFLKQDGSYAFILDRGYVLHDEYGTAYRMLGSMLDLTELKTAEQEIKAMNEQLEQKVELRTNELKEINEALEASNHDLQQFASVASHDLQEPLRKILVFSHMIRDRYMNHVEEGGGEYLDKIIHSAGRMKSLVTDILNYSSLSSQSSRFEVMSLGEIVSDILDDFEIRIQDKKAVIETGPLPELEVIPSQMRQVFQNLLSNALKFSKEGEAPFIRIHSVRVGARSTTAPEDPRGAFYRIHIKDNGIGFDEKYSRTIFNLFHRLNSKDRFEGTGIGLAVTKKIVERHRGTIFAQSSENEGAEFILVLPLTQLE